MISIQIDTLVSIVSVIGGVLLYVGFKVPKIRKFAKIGVLFAAYIRDINDLLLQKLLDDWSKLSIPEKLDRLKAIYDLIESFNIVTQTDKILQHASDDDIKKLLNGEIPHA